MIYDAHHRFSKWKDKPRVIFPPFPPQYYFTDLFMYDVVTRLQHFGAPLDLHGREQRISFCWTTNISLRSLVGILIMPTEAYMELFARFILKIFTKSKNFSVFIFAASFFRHDKLLYVFNNKYLDINVVLSLPTGVHTSGVYMSVSFILFFTMNVCFEDYSFFLFITLQIHTHTYKYMYIHMYSV